MTFPPKVWDGVLRRIQSDLPAFSIEAWLLPLVPDVGSQGEFLLLCPSAFHRDRVRDRFLDPIRACLRDEVGEGASVTLALTADRESANSPTGEQAGLKTESSPAPGAQRVPHPDTKSPMKSVRHERPARATGTHPVPNTASAATSGPRARTAARRPAGPTPTFDNFVVGPCNNLAREASLALANQDRGLTQLYLSSPHGLGKTHLSRAVVTQARRQDSARVIYASAETFTSEFMSSIQNRKTASFKQRWRRECDVLVIEDIQFLVGKRATQLELFHTVQHVLDLGRRVLLTGDRPAHELSGLDERVRSQLAGGFAACIDQPKPSVRCDILRAKASAGGIGVPEECLELIVQSVPGSVRELEGALIQIVTTASLMKRPIDMTLTREALERTVARPARPRPTPEAIIKAVASFYQTTADKLASRSRRRDILVPRQLAMYFCHRYTDASLATIGHALGRDHPSVRNAISRIERSMLERAPLRYKVEALSERLDQLGLGDNSPDPTAKLAKAEPAGASPR